MCEMHVCACAVCAFTFAMQSITLKLHTTALEMSPTYIPAPSLMRPNILGPQVTALDRFHCTLPVTEIISKSHTNPAEVLIYVRAVM